MPRTVEAASLDELALSLRRQIERGDESGIQCLTALLGASEASLNLKPTLSQLAARALLLIGPKGVHALASAMRAEGGAGVRYRPAILETLWRAGRGDGITNVMPDRTPDTFVGDPLPVGTEQAAAKAVRETFADATLDSDAFGLVTSFAHRVAQRTALRTGPDDVDRSPPEVMRLFSEASIKLSRSLLEEFASLITAELPEERYQEFLARNPVLLDPLAAEVIPKQRLGLEFATDFAVRRHDGRWIVVEIERPQDALFTAADDFRERFGHAFGQLLDFQAWVDNNVAYAQTHMPEIAAPRGMLIMGLRSGLTPRQLAKLRRYTDNSQRIEIHTYDDLLARATTLYENLYLRPTRLP